MASIRKYLLWVQREVDFFRSETPKPVDEDKQDIQQVKRGCGQMEKFRMLRIRPLKYFLTCALFFFPSLSCNLSVVNGWFKCAIS